VEEPSDDELTEFDEFDPEEFTKSG